MSLRKSHLKKISTLTDQHKLQLTKEVFPKLEDSEIALAVKDIDMCLVSTHPHYKLTYTQALRANIWLRKHGYYIIDLATDYSEVN